MPLQFLEEKEPSNLNDIVDRQAVDSEWRSLALDTTTALEVERCAGNVEDFWRVTTSQVKHVGGLRYPNLRKLTAVLFSLPSSNASVERTFSLLKNIKTDKRNKLKRQSVIGLLHAKQGMKHAVQLGGGGCGISSDSLQPDNKMLKLHSEVIASATDSEVADTTSTSLSK